MTTQTVGHSNQSLDDCSYPILTQCGLSIYMKKVIYCNCCQRLLLREEAHGHYAARSKEARKKKAYLKDARSKGASGEHRKILLRLRETLDALKQCLCATAQEFVGSLGDSPLKRAPIPQFPVDYGFACPGPNCEAVYADRNGLSGHNWKEHRGENIEPPPPGQKAQDPYQRVWNTKKWGLLRVNPQLLRLETETCPITTLDFQPSLAHSPWTSSAILSEPAVSTAVSSLRVREQAHIFSEIGFSERINQISWETRKQAITLNPKEKPLMELISALSFEYLSNALEAIDILAVHRPHYLKDISPTRAMQPKNPFRKVQNTSTVKKYSRGLAKLVLFSLRLVPTEGQVIESAFISITQNQVNALKHLRGLLRNSLESTAADTSADAEEEFLDWDPESEDYSNTSDIKHTAELIEAFHVAVISVYRTQSQLEEVTGSHLLPTYLILISLDSSREIFKCPRLLTSTYAGFKYIGKSATTQELFLKSDKGAHAIDQKEYENIIHWIVSANPTPFDWLSNKQSHLSTYVRRLPGIPLISWFEEDAEDCYLTYSGLPIAMSVMNSFMVNLCETLGNRLNYLLQGFDATPIPIHQIKDSLHNDQYSYSYLDSLFRVEQHSEPISLGYYKYIINTAQLRTGGEWNASVSEYLLMVKEFVLDLFLAVYFSSGMVSRGEELLSTTIRNTNFKNRNLYWLNGDLILKGDNSKTSSLTQKDSTVLHMLAPQVSACLLIYQTYILPVVYAILELARPIDFEQGLSVNRIHPLFTHLFAVPVGKGLLTTSQIAARFKTLSETWFNEPLGVSDWRHILLAIGRKQELLFERDYTALETQSGHSVRTGFDHYGILFKSFPGIQEPLSDKHIRMSKAWQGLWGLRDSDVFLDTVTGHWAKKIHNAMQKTGRDFDLEHFLEEKGPVFPWLLC